jgi:hypothetical protein
MRYARIAGGRLAARWPAQWNRALGILACVADLPPTGYWVTLAPMARILACLGLMDVLGDMELSGKTGMAATTPL